MDSLVRIGASQQSPDPHRSRRTSVAAPPPAVAQWDSAVNPVLSDADTEQPFQGASSRPSSRPGSRPGSRRSSQDAPRPVAQSMAVPARLREDTRTARAGSEPPVAARQGGRPGAELPLLQVPVFDGGKVPGAGTWVR